jgi:cyclic beta-1,2-glucan synthetase
VGALAHPLNRPEIGADGRVTAGYTVLQPRVEISPGSAERSVFSRFFSGDTGIDIYTRAVSETYQDLFGEGIYVGKGIYDVAGFRRSLEDRVPENRLLSHDLFEGIHGRAALVTDVVVYEDYPAHYAAYLGRLHRWVRGDWQILPWLLPRVPVATGGTDRNRLGPVDRFKILDNIRRSLGWASIVALLVARDHRAVQQPAQILAIGNHRPQGLQVVGDLVERLAFVGQIEQRGGIASRQVAQARVVTSQARCPRSPRLRLGS